MAQIFDMHVDGNKALAHRIRKIAGNLDDFKAANKKTAAIVTTRAKALAPKRTGRLANTIRPGATKRKAYVRAGNNAKAKRGVPYAGPIHWGWPFRHIKMNPFMTRAAQETEPVWTKYYKFAADQAIAKT